MIDHVFTWYIIVDSSGNYVAMSDIWVQTNGLNGQTVVDESSSYMAACMMADNLNYAAYVTES